MNTYRQLPMRHQLYVAQGLDGAWGMSLRSDYSAIVTIGLDDDGFFYILDVIRVREELVALRRTLIEAYRRWSPNVFYVEKAASGIAIQQMEVGDSTGIPMIPVQPLGSKESRVEAISPLFESGRVLLPRYAPAEMPLNFVDADEPASARRDAIPVPAGPNAWW